MTISSVLIANRGEIAIRIARACAALEIQSVAIFAEDDAQSLHVLRADKAVALKGIGASAYLDAEQMIQLAKAYSCQAIHPGYGFLAENAAFAARCAEEGIIFIGPSAETLEMLGDKTRARALAQRLDIPLTPGTDQPTSLQDAQAFFQEHGAMMIKALAGGGGRGMREVVNAEDIEHAYTLCQAESLAAFGCGDLYVERLIRHARHIEVQVVGDGQRCVHLFERDCSLQRRHQKLIEVAPAQALSAEIKEALYAYALKMAQALNYQGLATFEFLYDQERDDVIFMEANPRIQVEHTITEAITGVDLVKTQIQLASGATLQELALTQDSITQQGIAIELRVNLEKLNSHGEFEPAAGVISAYEPPQGLNIRVDGYGYTGYATSSRYDSMLAKVIVKSQGPWPKALKDSYRALCEFRLEGVPSNIAFLQNLVSHPALLEAPSTGFIAQHLPELIPNNSHPNRFFSLQAVAPTVQAQVADGLVGIYSATAGVLVELLVSPNDSVKRGQIVAIVEAMKMQFEVKAEQAGVVTTIHAQAGAQLSSNDLLVSLRPIADEIDTEVSDEITDLDWIRHDLAEVIERHAIGLDERRPEAVAKRHKIGMRTVRENINDLTDQGSFIEYGALALAAQRKRRTLDELKVLSPADGLVAGLGTVNAEYFGEHQARCMVMGYDYTVFAGTQGVMNHKKTERMLHLAAEWRIPLVLLAEGGGGRPNDTDFLGVAGLDNQTFIGLAKLSGQVPLVGVVAGRCFAGNAALLGCCDVIIATENSSIGMAGPAMIEGGGLGKFSAEEVGPAHIQAPNGVIDVLVKDEAEAIASAKQYLSYFQGDLPTFSCEDQRKLRHLIPENRLRAYDIRHVIETLADHDSVLELRQAFAPGMITALIRIEGKAFGLIANNPQHLGGAIDSDAGDKAARFMQLCNAFNLPMISLCDTPGFMVGPEAEATGTVRHVSRMFVTAAALSVPFFTVVLRKGYGLGAQAMAAGGFHSAFFTIAWPSGEFGAMGLEGAVRLGFSKELAALEDPIKREKLFNKLVDRAYRHGKGINMASFLEIDDVIDPKDTRHWLLRGLASTPKVDAGSAKRGFIDTW